MARRKRGGGCGLVLLVLLGVGGAVAFYAFRAPPIPDDPLAAVPASARALLRVDLPALRESPLFPLIAGPSGADEWAAGLEARCGFDPLGMVDAALAFVTAEAPADVSPLDAGLGHVGFVLAGRFDHERLATCLRSAVTQDGEDLEMISLAGYPAVAVGGSRAAFVGKHGIVLGDEELVVAALRTLDGDAPSLRDEAPELGALFDRVGRTPGGSPREVAAVAALPPRWRTAADGPLGELATLAELDPPPHAPEALALGARVSRGLALGLLLHFADAQDASRLRDAAVAAKDATLGMPLVSMSPAGPALDALEVEARGGDASFAIDLDAARLAALLGAADLLGLDALQPGR
ncbi:MAG: hypothetical protein AAGH15_15710 [Myxococcota bacterium]